MLTFSMYQTIYPFLNSVPLRLGLLITLMLHTLSALAVEEPDYDVLAQLQDVEVRRYAPMRLAIYESTGDFESAGNKAFRPLFGYITGKNATESSYAMTAPVTQQPSGERWQVAFILPQDSRLEDLPAPDNAAIEIVEQPARTVAVMRYSGSWSRKRFAEHESLLRRALTASDWRACGDAIWARYNGPFTLWFLRRNEVQIPVARGGCQD